MHRKTSQAKNIFEGSNGCPTFLNMLFQILLGVIFGLMNLCPHYFNSHFQLPFYMDTIFTVTAAFFSLTSGIVCAAVFHTVSVFAYHFSPYSLFWSICSFSIVFIIRFYILRHKKIGLIDIVFLIFLISLIISFEGASIFTVMNILANYKETSQVRFMYSLLKSANLPVFISALLPRIPANIVDKAIAITFGWLCYKGLFRIFTKKVEVKG